ncbi:hypothetical protein QUA54_09005 [Microcoleus sp. MOSTC5]|uniref:hypothetical protein n=1 Tax=Microcoleus sp. MOSTC5 TaxID=3055378 RepID=UPI002FD743CC
MHPHRSKCSGFSQLRAFLTPTADKYLGFSRARCDFQPGGNGATLQIKAVKYLLARYCRKGWYMAN